MRGWLYLSRRHAFGDADNYEMDRRSLIDDDSRDIILIIARRYVTA